MAIIFLWTQSSNQHFRMVYDLNEFYLCVIKEKKAQKLKICSKMSDFVENRIHRYSVGISTYSAFPGWNRTYAPII